MMVLMYINENSEQNIWFLKGRVQAPITRGVIFSFLGCHLLGSYLHVHPDTSAYAGGQPLAYPAWPDMQLLLLG